MKQTDTFLKGLTPHKALAMALLFSVFVRFLETLLFDVKYPNDIDAFLYLGSRLGKGELLYMRDFETKSPALQYLFFIAHALGGIGPWKIMIFCTVLTFGFMGSLILTKDLAKRPNTPLSDTHATTLLFTGLSSALLYSFPDTTIAQVNMIAAPLSFFSFSVIASGWHGGKGTQLYFAAGFALSFAALIRPNLSFHLVFAMIWLLNDIRLAWDRRAGIRLVVFSIGVVLPIAAACIPYLFVTGGTQALMDGMTTLAHFGKGMQADNLTVKQLDGDMSYFHIPFYLLCLVISFMVFNPRNVGLSGFRRQTTFTLFSIALLNYSFIRTHYLKHYVLLLVPFSILLLYIAFYALVHERKPGSLISLGMPVRFTLMAILAMSILGPVALPAFTLERLLANTIVFNAHINDRNLDHALLRYLDSCKKNGDSFLCFDSPLYHRLLDESRIGDGHPQILKLILRGKDVGPVGDIRLYSESVRADSCLALTESGKDIIVFVKSPQNKAFVKNCLEKVAGPYAKDTTFSLSSYMVYRLRR